MQYDTIILGAGAAGMMCATQSGGRTLVLDHAKAPGEKIRISGGGRCNFTNMYTDAENFLSANPHYCKSALSRYTQWDFVDLMGRYNIAWHEKALGQLFCDTTAKDVVAMLVQEMSDAGAELWLKTSIKNVTRTASGFLVNVEKDGSQKNLECTNLVLATGGKSIPKMGATGLAYDIATQFGLNVLPIRAGLVPFTFPDGRFTNLAGVALPTRVRTGDTEFTEAMLFTHRGLSGPAILQISSYWQPGDEVSVNFFPDEDLFETLRARRAIDGRRNLSKVLATLMPTRLAEYISDTLRLKGNLGDQSDTSLHELSDTLTNWRVTPTGTEGYRTAEVTLGGIDTNALSSKSMMTKAVPNLYVIGEAVDVTGWLGGYNFQWAWSSGHAAGSHIREALA